LRHAAGFAHANVERWSRGTSPLHSVDARAKLGALLVFLTAIATTPERISTSGRGPWIYGGYFALLLVAIAIARLPLSGMLGRAALVLPFSAVFALVTWWGGDARGARVLATKSFLSVLGALTLAASTPWVRVLDALATLHVPRPLILVIQFIGRYLFVVTDQAARMRMAAQSRQGAAHYPIGGARGLHAASGAVGVLFARSWERADGIYRAMLARGFTGRYPAPGRSAFQTRDAAFLSVSVAATVAIRVAL
jgi:cobalt/nickel transport system permease protein